MPTNVTVYIGEDLHQEMSEHPEVNWSEVCRKGVRDYLSKRTDEVQIMEKVSSLLEILLPRLDKIELDIKLLKQFTIENQTQEETEK
jgi:Arc/MetJ-type ribon-helix-helix transcriptional regulator